VKPQIDFARLVDAVARSGDREAFAQLFDHFAPRINGYLQRLGADPTLAEEVTQDVMTTLWQKAGLFDPAKSSVATWLYRIARNRRIDALRQNRFEPLGNSDLESAVDNLNLDHELDMQQREAQLRRALQDLPKEQLSLVRLAFFEGLSHSEIAEKLGLPLGTVKSRIRLAFTRLRRQLELQGVVEAG
jgi:RNA polymerase sigma factor (sigma-70 family)